MSIEPVQLVKEAQQDLFEANGLTAPLTQKEDPKDLDAALMWLGQHAPVVRDFVKSQSEQPIDWIDTSWTNEQ